MPGFSSPNLVFLQKRYSSHISIQEGNVRHGKSSIMYHVQRFGLKEINNAVTSLHDGTIVGRAIIMP
jgi:D-arabinose 1-dehydrogenase-like Zn-dependent alcohol dehydrogenase